VSIREFLREFSEVKKCVWETDWI